MSDRHGVDSDPWSCWTAADPTFPMPTTVTVTSRSANAASGRWSVPEKVQTNSASRLARASKSGSTVTPVTTHADATAAASARGVGAYATLSPGSRRLSSAA